MFIKFAFKGAILMVIIRDIIQLIFAIALFINAALFIPQAIRIYTSKSAQNISLLTFGGFLCIQFATVLHAWIVKDYILLIGFLLSMLTCGSVVFFVLRYQNGKETKISALKYNKKN